jgi:lysophospholipase L1-like esterase
MKRAAAGVLSAMWMMAVAAPAASETVPASDARVARMGRTVQDPDGAVRFGYPGVTLRVAFTGTRLSMDAQGGTQGGNKSLVDVIVDGGAPTTVALTPGVRSIELVKDAKPGRHTVEVVHRTETWLGVVSVARFATDGKVAAAPALPRRKLLVLGDSVTCGANMERPDDDKNNPHWWNARVSYGMLLGRDLEAQVQLVCFGGRGLVRSWNGKTDEYQLADYYGLAIPDASHPAAWNQADYAPDLILVAIGTNDFNQGIPDRASYVVAYELFVRKLLRDHPHAQVVLTEGAILKDEKKAALTSYIAETVKRVPSSRVHAVTSLHHPGDALDAHPTTAQHAEMARELAPALRKLMGW